MMKKGICDAFDCEVDFYTENSMVFTFNYEEDPVMQLRISNDRFEVIGSPALRDDNLLAVAAASKNASACMTALQVIPKSKR